MMKLNLTKLEQKIASTGDTVLYDSQMILSSLRRVHGLDVLFFLVPHLILIQLEKRNIVEIFDFKKLFQLKGKL